MEACSNLSGKDPTEMMMTIVFIIHSKHWRKRLLELNHWNLRYLGKHHRKLNLREDKPDSKEVECIIISIRIYVF